jgi:predicted ArsR family transcriptional regulator
MRPRARTTDPDTSKIAADMLDEKRTSTIMARIYRSLHSDGPGTFWQLAVRLQLHESQVWKRISDLRSEGLVEDSGHVTTGPLGRPCVIWQIKPAEVPWPDDLEARQRALELEP